jgi:tRNA(adenine34) deaminase
VYLESDERYMDLALIEARNAASMGEVPVGAVVVLNGNVLGRGFNQPITASDPTAHAEIIALREAARSAGNYRLAGVTVYCTLEPCLMCAGAMIHARIDRLVFATFDPKAGCAGSIHNVLRDLRFNHQVDVSSGIRALESSTLLREFFANRRM